MARARENGEKKVSQKKMVQAALDHCGADAKPGEMGDYIKSTFNAELAPNIISNYKSQIKREGGLSGIGGGRSRKGGSFEVVNDLKVLQGLVSRLGAEQVKELVDVVS
jgi:hypothetical protein